MFQTRDGRKRSQREGLTWSWCPPSWAGRQCCRMRRGGVSACLEPNHLPYCRSPWSSGLLDLKIVWRWNWNQDKEGLSYWNWKLCGFFSSAVGDDDIVDSHDTHKISIINCDSANHLFSTPTPCLPSFPTRIWSNKRRTGRDYCPAPVAFVDVNNSSKNIRSSSDVLDSCGC